MSMYTREARPNHHRCHHPQRRRTPTKHHTKAEHVEGEGAGEGPEDPGAGVGVALGLGGSEMQMRMGMGRRGTRTGGP